MSKTIRRNLLLMVALLVSAAFSPSRCFAQLPTAETVYQQSLPAYADSSTAPLAPQVVSSGAYSESTWQKITYLGKADRVPGLLFLPVNVSASKPVPCLLLLHPLGGSKDQLTPVARFFASFGYASWLIDDAGSGERAPSPGYFPPYSDLRSLSSGVDTEIKTTVVDLRRGIDYLDTRPEIDHKHIAAFGISLGAELAGILSGVDSRVSAVVIVSGGGNLGQILVDQAKNGTAFGKIYPKLLFNADSVALEQALAQVDPINFVAHIAPRPLLMEHGRLDNIIPQAAAQALFDAAAQPKQIIWYPNDGHIPPPLEIYPSISEFLDKYLPVSGR